MPLAPPEALALPPLAEPPRTGAQGSSGGRGSSATCRLTAPPDPLVVVCAPPLLLSAPLPEGALSEQLDDPTASAKNATAVRDEIAMLSVSVPDELDHRQSRGRIRRRSNATRTWDLVPPKIPLILASAGALAVSERWLQGGQRQTVS